MVPIEYNILYTYICVFLLGYKNIYLDYRNKVPITYNLPVISGQIMWISMMYEKIETPMKYFMVKLQKNCLCKNENSVDFLKLREQNLIL